VTTIDLPVPPRVLAIGAHPDDIEFGCGATLARWSADGAEVHHLVLTDGSKGTWDAEADLTELVAIRHREQRAAAAALGCTGGQHFLDRVDGELTDDTETRREVVRVIRQVQPTIIVGHDPWKRYRLHPDHRAAGFLTVDGVVAARDPHFFAELGLAPHRPDLLLLFEADEPNHVEAADVDTAAAKIAALLEHRTQWRSTMDIDGPDDEVGLTTFEQRVRDRLGEHGALASKALGEAFRLLDDL
jgi:LmbE family N-acetylglucosaminyl deacetylase